VVSPDTLVSSINKTDRHHITEILLKVALNTINHTKPNIISRTYKGTLLASLVTWHAVVVRVAILDFKSLEKEKK
jgi:hypothetical protein